MNLDQVKTFMISLGNTGVKDDEGEEVINPWYLENFECFLVLELN